MERRGARDLPRHGARLGRCRHTPLDAPPLPPPGWPPPAGPRPDDALFLGHRRDHGFLVPHEPRAARLPAPRRAALRRPACPAGPPALDDAGGPGGRRHLHRRARRDDRRHEPRFGQDARLALPHPPRRPPGPPRTPLLHGTRLALRPARRRASEDPRTERRQSHHRRARRHGHRALPALPRPHPGHRRHPGRLLHGAWRDADRHPLRPPPQSRRLHGHRHRGGRLEPPRRGGEEGIARGACASSSPTRAAAFPPPTSPTSTRASGGRTRAVPSPGTGSDSPSSRPSSRRTAAASTATRSPAKAAPSRSSSRRTGREDDRRGLSSWPVPAGSRPSDGRRRGTSRAPARFR